MTKNKKDNLDYLSTNTNIVGSFNNMSKKF